MAELEEKIDSVNVAISKINQEKDTLNNKLIAIQETGASVEYHHKGIQGA